MINGRSARNDPNTQASTSSAPNAPMSSSLSTLELPCVVFPAASDFRLVPWTALWFSVCGKKVYERIYAHDYVKT